MRTLAIRLGALLLLLAWADRPAHAADDVKVEADVVYGRKDGMALTLDVIKPAKPGGAALLWVQSGGWYSRWVDPKLWPAICKPYLDKGYTVFIVRHGSAPKYAIPEIVEDMRLSVRFVRLKAKGYGVNPERLGVLGGSAGGHLALVLGTTGDDGDPKAKEAVRRQPSRVAAVVALYPPTDLRDWVSNPPEIIRKHAALKPPLTFEAKKAPDYSPVLKATAKSAPALLIHGDKDELVPIEHSEKMLAAMEKAKAACKLVTIKGAAHGFNQKQNKEVVLPEMMAWLEKHLAEKKEE